MVEDLARAMELDQEFHGLQIGIVDGVVAALAEALAARASVRKQNRPLIDA